MGCQGAGYRSVGCQRAGARGWGARVWGTGGRDAGVQGPGGQAVAVGSTSGSPRTPHLKKSWDSKVLSAGRHLGMGFSRVECKVCWKLERTSAETEIQSDS